MAAQQEVDDQEAEREGQQVEQVDAPEVIRKAGTLGGGDDVRGVLVDGAVAAAGDAVAAGNTVEERVVVGGHCQGNADAGEDRHTGKTVDADGAEDHADIEQHKGHQFRVGAALLDHLLGQQLNGAVGLGNGKEEHDAENAYEHGGGEETVDGGVFHADPFAEQIGNGHSQNAEMQGIFLKCADDKDRNQCQQADQSKVCLHFSLSPFI